MWSPMGSHVQWDLSNVVTCGTSFPKLDWTGCCISEIKMCIKVQEMCILGFTSSGDHFRQDCHTREVAVHTGPTGTCTNSHTQVPSIIMYCDTCQS